MPISYFILFFIIISLIYYKLYIYHNNEKFELNDKDNLIDYNKCCNKFGCNSYNCQYLQHFTSFPFIVIGYFYNGSFHNIVQKLSHIPNNDFEYKYYYINDGKLIELKYNKLIDNQIISINNQDITVHLFSFDMTMLHNYFYFDNLQTFNRFIKFDKLYSNRLINTKIQKVGELMYLTPGYDGFCDLYEIQIVPRRNIYKYYTFIDGSIIEIKSNDNLYWDRISNKINNNDNISLDDIFVFSFIENINV